MKLSLVAQIAEVEREIDLRKKQYPQFVRQLKMRQGEADYHLAAMESVLNSLRFLQRNEQKVRELFGGKSDEQKKDHVNG